MTTYAAPQAAPGRWVSAAELAHESGLREDLVRRFIPANDTGPAPMYTAAQIPLAKLVKRLADMSLPANAIDTAVRELNINPAQLIAIANQNESGKGRSRWLAIAGGAAAIALIVGGIAGGLIGAANRSDAKSAPVTVTAEVPPASVNAGVPNAPDPVCAKWAPQVDSYNAKEASWTKTDPRLSADQWTPDQRALSMAVIPVLQAEAADMRRLAAEASDPYLAGLMKGQAAYEAEYATRLPNYQPSDQRFWDAVISFNGAVKAVCTATK